MGSALLYFALWGSFFKKEIWDLRGRGENLEENERKNLKSNPT
jgi:hypothetical protein